MRNIGEPTFKEKIRLSLEAVFATLLFMTQSVVYGGWAISVMSIPLLPYLVMLATGHLNLERDINLLFFAKEFIVGRVIALIGFTLFLVAGIQFLRDRARGAKIIKTGLYSVVRHPQYLGIIITTIGLTVMVLTLGGNPQIILSWLIQVLGYVILARYEELYLEKQHGEAFRQYRRNVPFMFLIKCSSKIPETIFTILIAVIISFVFLIFPFDIIRIR
ncbi:MAG: NnrU family protein [Candidatus Bathyarchaeia archaeon]